MLNSINTFNCLVKGSFLFKIHHRKVPHDHFLEYEHLCDIFNNDDLMLITIRAEQLPEVYCLFLRPNCSTDRVPFLEEGADNPNRDIAVRARDENLAWKLDSWHDEVFEGER